MGRPKALVEDWLVRAVTALRDGGCGRVLVVLGASADEARLLLKGHDVDVVVAEDWVEGMGASLGTGLATLGYDDEDAAVVSLVDLPDVGPAVVSRLLSGGAGRDDLRRAAYDGRPGHPVLIGRAHWAGVITSVRGDEGARAYLADREVRLVECGDLATGRDVDVVAADSPTRDQPVPE